MNHPNPRQFLEDFAHKFQLRYLERERRYLGVYRGICIDAGEFERSINIYFFSPGAHFSADDILDKPTAFPHVGQTSVPVDWMTWRMLHSGADRQGCLLELSPARLKSVSEESLFALPDAIAEDLQVHGAVLEPPDCSLCGGSKAKEALYINDTYQFACQACFDNLAQLAPGGTQRNVIPIRWGKAVAVLLLASCAFALLWGLIQQSQQGIQAKMLLMAPLLGSVFVCKFVADAAQGMNRSLRTLTIACILAAILAGNIWGFRTAAMRQAVPLSWADAAGLYFTVVLPADNGSAGWYLLGGLAGCWVGFTFLKSRSLVKFR